MVTELGSPISRLQANHMMLRCFFALVSAFAVLVFAGVIASAHPHVWVTVKSDLVYAPDGSVTGVRHAWTFDDMFSTFATQGINSKKKGQFTREELAPLAEVNVSSLKEYDYFTYAAANGKRIEFNEPPAGYYLDFDPMDAVLTLHFTLPLKTPVKAKISPSKSTTANSLSTSASPRKIQRSSSARPRNASSLSSTGSK